MCFVSFRNIRFIGLGLLQLLHAGCESHGGYGSVPVGFKGREMGFVIITVTVAINKYHPNALFLSASLIIPTNISG